MIRHVLEPKPIHSLQMVYTSDLYEHYSGLLKSHSKMTASDLSRQYCLTIRPDGIENQLAYAEFLYMNGYIRELNIVMRKFDFDEDIVFLYEVMLTRIHLGDYEFPEEWLDHRSFTHPSLKCLHKFIYLYYYYGRKKFSKLDQCIEICDELLRSVNEPLVHYYFQLRYNELLFHHYWKTNNPLLARRYAYKIINTELSPRKSTTMHHSLALTHVFESYELAMDQACNALHIALEYDLPEKDEIRHRTIPFIAALHQKVEKDMDTPDLVESAHLDLARGDHDLAASKLKTLTSLTPFQQCYLGAALGDRNELIHSRERFITEYGDQFFAQLPDFYLNRLST
ncbi:hypothetical protein EQV77_15300 [Halobacillus fulvus]|nr:hypothetical protein EQV77_15300 [Halobacillus fulvus]